MGSWSGTKQLKSLDMSRAPGHLQGYPCLGHGLILGLVPWWIRPQKCSEATWSLIRQLLVYDPL
jgi:hypothetical protein